MGYAYGNSYTMPFIKEFFPEAPTISGLSGPGHLGRAVIMPVTAIQHLLPTSRVISK
jgi:hypothetical protein